MQQITIVGHLGKDAVIKSSNGKDFLAFNVCVTETYKNAAGEKIEESTWYSCMSRNTGVAAYLLKGSLVAVSGELKAKIYTKDNKSSLDLSIQVYRLKLGSSKKDS